MPLPLDAPAWLTPTARPATVTLAFRAPLVLAATETVAVPEPVPDPDTAAHDTADDDVQARS